MTEQQRHLPAASMEREPHAELLTFSNPCGGSGKSEALCAPGGLVGQDVLGTDFMIAILTSPHIYFSSVHLLSLQHTRLPCPSPTLGARSNSCPSSS